MIDQYPSEEEYQQKLDEIRERDPNLYEYIMWGNSSDEPFDYDAMEVRLLLAIKEQEEEQKQSVGDLSKMTAMEIAERILAQYGMGQEVYRSGKEIADAMRYNPAKVAMHYNHVNVDISGAGMYERKEIAPGKFINVRTPQPFTPAWFNVREYGAVGDGFIDDAEAIRNAIDGSKAEISKLDNNGVDGHILVEDEASTWEMPGKYEPQEGGMIWADKVTRDEDSPYYGKSPVEAVESAIDWEKLEAARNDEAFQQQMEQHRRDITAIFGITPEMLGIHSVLSTSQKVAVEIQRQEICIELLVGHKEMEKHRYELRERAASCAAHCFHANGYAEYYEMVYRLCAEGYSLEQAIYGYKKQVEE